MTSRKRCWSDMPCAGVPSDPRSWRATRGWLGKPIGSATVVPDRGAQPAVSLLQQLGVRLETQLRVRQFGHVALQVGLLHALLALGRGKIAGEVRAAAALQRACNARGDGLVRLRGLVQ